MGKALNEVHSDMETQHQRAEMEYATYATPLRGKKPVKQWPEYTGFVVDYNVLAEKIIQALQEDYKLTDKQARYIYGFAYHEYHSNFGDVIYHADELATFVENFPKC